MTVCLKYREFKDNIDSVLQRETDSLSFFVTFGWFPTFLWIVLGTIFIGGVHDMGSLVASVRHKASGIADTMKNYVSKRVWILFNIFIFFTLVMLIVAFTDITTSSFVNTVEVADGVVGGGATATSSILYLILPIIMGFLLKYTKLKLSIATVIFLPLVAISIWIGQYIPFSLQDALGLATPKDAQKVWNFIIIIYCFVAGIVPVWALLHGADRTQQGIWYFLRLDGFHNFRI